MSQPFPNHPLLKGSFAPILFEADAYDLPVRARNSEGNTRHAISQ
jgi:hypothetical protein